MHYVNAVRRAADVALPHFGVSTCLACIFQSKQVAMKKSVPYARNVHLLSFVDLQWLWCRSKTQGIALSLGDKLILKQKG